ncbi:receptor-type tyrosine-protein kinase FLT3 isoform X2 [Crotalus tigris]|uniref:receptor-type tyrosine-protein kinase FLT3 isoform X2 n=1 Tax=Crotalus tigris TaxID=88082 RepID=UPI00192F558B|nr:receptor-type tyrosine-protein kinase FLT3 isoform X2 [Crotalus tigris]
MRGQHLSISVSKSQLQMLALILTVASTGVISQTTFEITCFLIKQHNNASRNWEFSPSLKMQDNVEDLQCSLNTQNTENIYKTTKVVEVGVLENVRLKAVLNISENIVCHWVFKEIWKKCNSSLDLENRHIISVEFPQIKETQGGNHTLFITTETNNYTIVFMLNIRRSPGKPYFMKHGDEGVRCISEGHPTPVLEWLPCQVPDDKCRFVSGDLITEKAQLHLRQEDLLFEPHVWCCATNNLGKVCTELYTIDLSGTSESPVQELFLRVGDPLFLRCRSKYNTSQFGNKWHFGNEQLKKNMILEGRWLLSSSWVKTLYAFMSSVEPHNDGNYTCSSKEIAAEKTAVVRILDKGFINITNAKEDFEVGIEEDTCLEVKLKAYPPIRCIWIFSQISFPCQQNYTDTYSISARFCDHKNQPGEYLFYAENSDVFVKRTLRLYVKSKPKIKMSSTFNQLSCTAESNPAPLWIWKECYRKHINCTEITDGISNEKRQGTIFGSWISSSTLNTKNIQTGRFIECCANNLVGYSCESYFIEPKGNVLLYATFGVCFPIIVGLCIITCRNYKKQFRYERQLHIIQMVGPSDNEYIYINFSELEYDVKWEFPRENLKFGQVLGSGAFGKVVNATAYGISEAGASIQVAVKMLKEKYDSLEKDALMSELKMMIHIGSHENIVNLLGACTKSGPVYLIFEYCCYGDLLNYLRSKRETFHKTWAEVFSRHNFSFYHNFRRQINSRAPFVSRNGIIVTNGSYLPVGQMDHSYAKQDLDVISKIYGSALLSEEDELKYVNRKLDVEESLNILTFEDLLCFSYQVARGMEFLESKSCVHRDLAARNILITYGKVAKICDFGLARDIMNDSNYVVRGNARLPVKWMSPESLFEGIYTIKSDVWSYGILLWEIFSLGINPYPGMQVNEKFYKLIQNGFKMDRPFYATEEIYVLLCSCWALDSRKRPSFSQLLSLLACQLAEAEGAACQADHTDTSKHTSSFKCNPDMRREAEFTVPLLDEDTAREK